jgi:hypothetical protein
MTRRFASLTSMFVLALGIAAFTGSALAGNGNGNGAVNATTPGAPATENASQGPGNSENAPGQVKKDTATTKATGDGSADQNTATSSGLKPTNATAKDTHALATSNQTKRYGNGTTAGQVAVQAGYTGMLHGPGNSQPHKAALCPGGHEVDVHALKAKGQQKRCGVISTPHGQSQTTNAAVVASVSGNPTATSNVAGQVSGGAQGAAVSGAGPTAHGGVLGVTESAPAGGVLGAIESVGQGVLPFTGFPLWVAVVFAMALIVLGLALRRRARATA